MKQKIVAIAAIIFWGIACIKGNYSVVIRDSVDEVEEWGGLGEYRKIIEEYGYMLGNDNRGFIPEKWEYVYKDLFYIGKYKGVLYYTMVDITGDGYPELIVGRGWDTANRGPFLYKDLYLSYREEDVVLKNVADTSIVRPYIVYYRGEEGMETCVCDKYKMTIYQSGVIELEKPYVRKYLQIEKGTGRLKYLDEFKSVRVQSGQVEFYRRDKESGGFEEIPKEKYIDNVNRYLMDMMELEWIPIYGRDYNEERN